MSKVYAIQEQFKRDRETGEMVPAYNMEPASDYGELVYVVSPEALPYRPASIIRQMHEVLKDFTKDDYLLLIGNPALIGWATAIATKYAGGTIKQLQWDARSQSYLPLQADIFDTE